MQTRTKNLIVAATMFACLAMPLWICYTLLIDLRAAIEANPIVKIPVAAIIFAVILSYTKHKTGYELKSSVVNVNVIGGSHD